MPLFSFLLFLKEYIITYDVMKDFAPGLNGSAPVGNPLSKFTKRYL